MRSKTSTLERTRRFSVVAIIPGAEAATPANYGDFFIAERPCTVLRVSESHTDLSTGIGAETLDIEKLTTGQASGAGVAVLGAAKIDLTAAIDTVQSPALTAVGADLILAAGDRLSLNDDGALTALEGVCVTVDLQEEVGVALRAKVAMYDTRRILLPIHLPDAIAGTALNYGVIFICPAANRYIFVGAEVVYTVKAGADAGLQLEKLVDGEAPDAAGGDDLLLAEVDLELDAEVVQYCAPVADVAARTLGAGDRICLVDRGNVAAVRNLQVTIELEELIPVRAKQAPTEDERIFVTAVLYGAQPQTTAMLDKFFTASKPCRIVAARQCHTTAVGGVCTLQIEKLTGIETPGTGTALLDGTGFNLNAAADTIQVGTLTTTVLDRILAIGDRLALDETGALLAAVAGLSVTVELEAIQ